MRRPTRILLTTQMIAVGAAGMLTPIYAIYVQKIGGDIIEAAGAWTIFSIVSGVLTILFGRLTDKVREPEYFIVAGFFVAAAGYFGYTLVQNPLHLFIVQIVLGVSVALMTPAHDALYTEHLDGGRFASEWGFWEGMWNITEAVTAFIGGLIVASFGFKILFIAMALLAFVTGVYIWLLPRRLL